MCLTWSTENRIQNHYGNKYASQVSDKKPFTILRSLFMQLSEIISTNWDQQIIGIQSGMISYLTNLNN